ncbi:MAG: chemotaxis protein CheA [Planctomycetia bacterium]|nr:chemotaxis protein CheA [Planctomycetia bacterium]
MLRNAPTRRSVNDIVREFLLETNENLAQLDLDLVTLEQEPGERETLARVFRTLHTVKGTAGFLGLAKLQSVSHAGENLLSRLRAGDLTFNPEIATALLSVVDAIRKMLASVESTEQEGEGDYSALIQTLEKLTKSAGPPRSRLAPLPNPLPPPAPPPPPAAVAPPVAPPSAPAAPTNSFASEQTLVRPQPFTPVPPPAPIPFSPSAAASEGTKIIPTPAARGLPAPLEGKSPPDSAETRVPAVSDSSIRVDVGLLDKLMTLVGELVLARNQIVQFGTTQEDAGFRNTVQRLNLLTTELQAGVMKTRMQPIGNVWAKFPRLVRDLAVAVGKQVRLDMEGQETELDRSISEAIRDPLTHMVRNAVDHGIELPGSRMAQGKPLEGRLHLRAFHEGGKVIIEITDDGGGIDPIRVRDKAISAKLITPEQAARMSNRELVNLVFLPGFSTADRVTHFSGRGVGMDVVRTNIEKIGGTVDIESVVTRGTTVKMKIPLTLAIIPALTITTAGDRYAIPQVSLLELVRLEGEQVRKSIEQIHGAPVYRLRGNLLPLVYLSRELQVESTRRENGEVNIVVLQADDRQFGLVVDDIHDTEEIVVKPLQKQLKGITVFAGATIMGDGLVALILDVVGLAQRASVISGVRERALTETPATAAEQGGNRQTVLLFATNRGERMAVPLALVARLEEFPRSAVEKVGGQDVVQYRGEILPLLHVGRVLRGARNNTRARKQRTRAATMTDDKVQVVVYIGDKQRVGLVVGRIIDIVEATITTRAPANRPGVLFNAVVQDRVTEFLDIEGIIRKQNGEPRPQGRV